MKTTQKTILCVLLIAGALNSCKKKSDDPEPDPSTTTTTTGTTGSTPVNQLCDGKGTATFFPLDSLDKWTYGYKISGVSQSVNPSPQVTGTKLYGTVRYAVLKDASHYLSDQYLRMDATTSSIYRYNDNNSTEYLEIPGTPTLNQTWPTSSNTSRKVTNLSATVTTSGCSYTGLLEISELDASNAVTTKVYYKKGLGIVSSMGTGSFPDQLTLTAVVLK